MRVSSLFSPAFLSPTLLSLCIGIGLSTSAASAAPSAGQLAQPSYAPVQQRDSGRVTLPATTDLHAPQGSEQLYVVPSGIIVEGGYPELAQDTARIESTLKGTRVGSRVCQGRLSASGRYTGRHAQITPATGQQTGLNRVNRRWTL